MRSRTSLVLNIKCLCLLLLLALGFVLDLCFYLREAGLPIGGLRYGYFWGQYWQYWHAGFDFVHRNINLQVSLLYQTYKIIIEGQTEIFPGSGRRMKKLYGNTMVRQ